MFFLLVNMEIIILHKSQQINNVRGPCDTRAVRPTGKNLQFHGQLKKNKKYDVVDSYRSLLEKVMW